MEHTTNVNGKKFIVEICDWSNQADGKSAAEYAIQQLNKGRFDFAKIENEAFRHGVSGWASVPQSGHSVSIASDEMIWLR